MNCDHCECAAGGHAEGSCRAGERLFGVDDLDGRATCSVEQAAAILGIGRSTAYAAARDGSLPTLRLSGRLLVPVAKLRAMLGIEETKV